jgi:adenosyl cobinamide kinase/adenosyl cobinamide phosphate guanylyltransferase
VFQASTINPTFKLVNKSTNELIISEIRTGCSCTVVSNEYVGKTILPNQSIVILFRSIAALAVELTEQLLKHF